MFVDATGDGDVCAQVGASFDQPEIKQPPTACMKTYGWKSIPGFDLDGAIEKHRREFDLPEDWGWRTMVPGLEGLVMHADIHVFGTNTVDARSLTEAEMEGRRQNRALLDIMRRYAPEPEKIVLLDLASMIGIRETRHMRCAYELTEEDVLTGRRFPDAIANGSYRVDIHHEEKPGITFRYLDGTEVYFRRGHEKMVGRWREPTSENPTFYQIPYRCLLTGTLPNLVASGRMLDADKGAFGAVRVMVNMNQTGEAAGVAACLALEGGESFQEVDARDLRAALAKGGSIIL
jgi:hypothetical protein